jgi:hypothetical protein
MATKKQTKPSPKRSVEKKVTNQIHSEPIFPYTNKPASLRKFLQLIPQKPRPSKVDKTLMQSWGFRDTNDLSILRVLKAIGLLSQSNEPTPLYTNFMSLNGGAAALAQPVKDLYSSLFGATHAPYKETADSLKNLFNIHSGGSPTTLDLQIQTFKALAESTTFDVDLAAAPAARQLAGVSPSASNPAFSSNGHSDVPVHINLHIHLPENKSRRDYEAIIEDIGRYIYGRKSEGSLDE